MDHRECDSLATEAVVNARVSVMEAAGLTFKHLVGLHKKELKATITKTMKIKGAINPDDLPKGYRVVATSGQIIETKDGEVYGDGETLITWEETDWGTRMNSRKDAHDLRGDYPAKESKVQHSGSIENLSDEELKARIEALTARVVDGDGQG